jgi:anaerobic selenocysteine-containing dehydrogenase
MEGTCHYDRFQYADFFIFIGMAKRRCHNLGYGILLADREKKSIYGVFPDRWT